MWTKCWTGYSVCIYFQNITHLICSKYANWYKHKQLEYNHTSIYLTDKSTTHPKAYILSIVALFLVDKHLFPVFYLQGSVMGATNPPMSALFCWQASDLGVAEAFLAVLTSSTFTKEYPANCARHHSKVGLWYMVHFLGSKVLDCCEAKHK